MACVQNQLPSPGPLAPATGWALSPHAVLPPPLPRHRGLVSSSQLLSQAPSSTRADPGTQQTERRGQGKHTVGRGCAQHWPGLYPPPIFTPALSCPQDRGIEWTSCHTREALPAPWAQAWAGGQGGWLAGRSSLESPLPMAPSLTSSACSVCSPPLPLLCQDSLWGGLAAKDSERGSTTVRIPNTTGMSLSTNARQCLGWGRSGLGPDLGPS